MYSGYEQGNILVVFGVNGMRSLPDNPLEFMNWSWPEIEPYFQELENRELHADNVEAWLKEWARLGDLLSESYWRLYTMTTQNTADQAADERFQQYVDTIYPASQATQQKLKEKLLASGLEVAGFEVPLRNLRAEAEIFSEANLPLLSEEQKLNTEYDKIIGAQTVTWEGKEITVRQLAPVMENPDRSVRERAWRLAYSRTMLDRQAINALWVRFLELRQKIARNAGLDNFRDYRWKQLHRFDYTPEDCKRFHAAIEEVVVPAATRVYERGRRRLGYDTLRPWDVSISGMGSPKSPPDVAPLHPFDDVSELVARCQTMFEHVDSQFGEYFEIMQKEGMLDLENRKHKAPGAYSVNFEASKLPFIFANSVGMHDDVQTVLHEGGHAFHSFEMRHLPYTQQRDELSLPMEFAEVASMGMELLASPYLPAAKGGFYSEQDAARALRANLDDILTLWPYIALVDAFQLWAYENSHRATDPATLDDKWQELWNRFMPGMDWSGLEEQLRSRWQRQSHIFTNSLYYIEYGIAQLGAVQVWANARKDQAKAVADYRHALSLGATVPLPQLYKAAGAEFSFEPGPLREAVELMERVIQELGNS